MFRKIYFLSTVFILVIRVWPNGCKNGKQNSLAILDMGDFKVQTLKVEFDSLL